MRKLAFETAVRLTAATIWVVDKITWLVVGVPAFLLMSLKVNVAKFGMWLMQTLDQPRLEAAEERIDNKNEAAVHNAELGLLRTASLIKENAEETGEWTDHHTEALNEVGEALVVHCEWDEDDVHATLKRIVESIEGLEYQVEEELGDE